YFEQPRAVGWALLLLVSVLMAAPYYMAFAAVYVPLVRRFRGAAAPLLSGAAWAGADLLRGRLLNGSLLYFGNSPWPTFGYSQTGVGPLVQIASLTGVYGISFTLACANAALAEAARDLTESRRIERSARRALVAAALVVGMAWGFGALALRRAPDVSAGTPRPLAPAPAHIGAAAGGAGGGALGTVRAPPRG